MKTYNVVWAMPIEADSAKQAAQLALEIHRNPESIATVFEVSCEGVSTTVDLEYTAC